MMDNQIKTAEVRTRGTWFQRALIWFFAGLLSLLIYWLFGFVIDDIGMQGPVRLLVPPT